MSPDYPDPSVDSIPSMGEIAPYYDALLDVAESYLHGPISISVETWEDGQFKIRAQHVYTDSGPVGERLEGGAQYHSRSGEIRVVFFRQGDDSVIWGDTVASPGAPDDAVSTPGRHHSCSPSS